VTTAVLSLGSNLGDRYAHLLAAADALREQLVVISGVYETPPWFPEGYADEGQPPYLNAAALVVDPGAGAYDWLELARRLEQAAGRVRDPERRFAPRTLDVDVIVVSDEVTGEPVLSDDPELLLPHPRAYARAFVLRPWLDIQPYARLPGYGQVHELIRREPAASDVSGLTPRPELSLEPLR
jgi:2-amino-4-hydroxy-6-hydroxymethyldihydropteridine diphosphokinase